MDELTTWRTLLELALSRTGDKFKDLTISLSDEELDREFDSSFGAQEGQDFTAYSKDWVYFNYEYDGSDFIINVPRNPERDKTFYINGKTIEQTFEDEVLDDSYTPKIPSSFKGIPNCS